MKASRSPAAAIVDYPDLPPEATIILPDVHVNGISADARGKVFYSPMTSLSLYEVDAAALMDEVAS